MNNYKFNNPLHNSSFLAAKRMIHVWPQTTGDAIPLAPRRILKGVAPMEISPITFSQDGKEYLAYDVTCSIDDVEIPLLI